MTAPITEDDVAAAREATRAQRDLELALLAAEARLAIEAVSPIVALLPEPARTVVKVLERIVGAL